MTRITRRDFITTAAGVGALTLATRPARLWSGETDRVRIGYIPITDAAPLLIAHGLKYFEEEGLAVDEPVRIRNWSSLAESFMTGKFNLVHLLLPIPVWMRYNTAVPAKVLAWDHTNGSALTVKAGSGINGFQDLGGRQIAVPHWYSMHNVILQIGLRKVGLTPVIQPQTRPLKPHEVNLFILPPPEMPVSLAGNKIDGFIVAEPYNALAEMRTGAKIMRFTGDIWKNHPCCVIVMNEHLIRSRPVFTQKIVNAIVRAQLWTTGHPEEAAKLLSRDGKNYLPLPPDVLMRVFTGYESERYGMNALPRAIRHPEWNIGRIGFQPFPYPSATRFIVKEMRATVMEGNTEFLRGLDPEAVVTDLVDDSFVRKAVDAAGGPGKFEAIDNERPWDREEVIDVQDGGPP